MTYDNLPLYFLRASQKATNNPWARHTHVRGNSTRTRTHAPPLAAAHSETLGRLRRRVGGGVGGRRAPGLKNQELLSLTPTRYVSEWKNVVSTDLFQTFAIRLSHQLIAVSMTNERSQLSRLNCHADLITDRLIDVFS